MSFATFVLTTASARAMAAGGSWSDRERPRLLGGLCRHKASSSLLPSLWGGAPDGGRVGTSFRGRFNTFAQSTQREMIRPRAAGATRPGPRRAAERTAFAVAVPDSRTACTCRPRHARIRAARDRSCAPGARAARRRRVGFERNPGQVAVVRRHRERAAWPGGHQAIPTLVRRPACAHSSAATYAVVLNCS
jgi:hypothetical protein